MELVLGHLGIPSNYSVVDPGSYFSGAHRNLIKLNHSKMILHSNVVSETMQAFL